MPCRFVRANLELPEASENVLSLDGTWRFALHSCPEDALASRFFGRKFREKAGVTEVGDGVSESGGRGGVRGADGCWRDTPVPSCWQMQVKYMAPGGLGYLKLVGLFYLMVVVGVCLCAW